MLTVPEETPLDPAERQRLMDERGKLAEDVAFMRALGVHTVSVVEGTAVVAMDWRADLVGDPETGAIMGGAVTTLIDHACGLAAWSRALVYPVVATLDLRIDYLKPATRGLPIHVRAECHRATRSVSFVRATAYHPDAKHRPIASAVATFMKDMVRK
jgi:uncharacterized protein (TIGR00369 family)